MKSRLVALFHGARRQTGMDHAIAYTLAARALNIIGSAGTVLLIVRFLGKIEQGYYYTLLSLVNLQIIFELGFSLVVLQMAAHEAVHLRFHPDGKIEGSPAAHQRMVAILRKTFRWYLVAGALMAMTLLPAGIVFFQQTTHSTSAVWLWPWFLAAIATVVLFVLNPFCSFLEGCGQVRQVAGMRLGQGILAIVAAWGSMLLGKGLFSPGMVVVTNVTGACVFLFGRRRLLFNLLRWEAASEVLSWRTEIWSFQWKIAIAWLCSYFTVQALVPIVFAARGAEEAGRLGMSLSVSGYMWYLVFAWMSTKAVPFGQLVAKKDFRELDHVFFRTLWQSVAILSLVVLGCMTCFLGIQRLYPALAERMVTPPLFALLLLSAISTLVVQCEAVYLRAHKQEPLIWQAAVVAIITSGGAHFAARRWGVRGTCIVYFLCAGVIGVVSASFIFQRVRRQREQEQRLEEAMVLEGTS